MHVLMNAHAHPCTRVDDGGGEMGAVSLLLPSCCHGDADGAFTAIWDPHFTTHTPTLLFIDARTRAPFESSLAFTTAFKEH